MEYKGKARAHTNIALIKYWGKADEALILPMNNSLSLTLDRFYTETCVTFDPSYTADAFTLNGERMEGKALQKMVDFLDIVRTRANTTLHAHVDSQNFVPTAAGLASSASAYAALAQACNIALDMQLSDRDVSRLARRGSGSASRSIFGGFVEWEKGYDDETSYSYPIDANHWEDELAMLFIVINNKEKKVPSRYGMSLTRDTSRFYHYWLDHIDADLQEAKAAIAERDFQRLGEVIEANGLRMHATNLGAQPPFTYLVQESYDAMAVVHQCREAGILCYYTMDAGPNVKVLVEKKNQHKVIEALQRVFDEEQIIASGIGSGVETIE